MSEEETEKKAKEPKERKERGRGSEAIRVKARLEGFSHADSGACQYLEKRFPGIVHKELKAIATILCTNIGGLILDRDAARDTRVLHKWFDENWDKIAPCIGELKLLDENKREISRSD